MSLVEQALKKAKASGAAAPGTRADALGPAMPGTPPASGSNISQPTGSTSQSGDLTDRFLAPRLISIDFDGLRRIGYAPPIDQEREVSEQFRHVKRPLVARAFGRGMEPIEDGRVIVISSALPGEGKTFCSINLARSLALESDSNVLLVDADTAKPQVSRALGQLGEPGLVDALFDESVDVESLVCATSVPKLSVLPAGRESENAAELLGSARMGELLRQLVAPHRSNRIVVLDSPPLLVTNEAKTLVDYAGQVVLVVRAGVTPRSAVLDAIAHLREDQFVGVILNESDATGGVGYGYGYYGQMYQYGRTDDDWQRGKDGHAER